MKHVEASLSAREDRENSFHHCGDSVMLVKACLCARKSSQSRFNLLGGAVKQVQACLSAREGRESSFHRCGRPVSLIQACLCAGSPDKT